MKLPKFRTPEGGAARTHFQALVLYCTQYAPKGDGGMFSIVLRFAVTVAAIPLCATYYPGVHMQNLQAALIAGAALGAFYALLRPLARLLLKIINFLTLGLIYILIDTWLVWTVAGMYPDAIAVDSFLWAAAVAASVNIARMIIDIITRSMKR